MVDQEKQRSIPEFVFICGAVGSGNTFMFNCLAQDENVYGVNEDAFGSTLHRLIESERTMGKCPHSIQTFQGFLQVLRRDRRTLILRTPSNLRHVALLREHLPGPRFIVMIREPHAAIVSGMARHAPGTSIEKIARIWLADFQYFAELDCDSIVVTFEELVGNPMAALERVSSRVLPLSEAVFAYARRMHDPQRADGERWKTKVDEEVRRQIEHWVELLELEKVYQKITGEAGQGQTVAVRDIAPNGSSSFWRPLAMVRRQFFRGWYRLRR